jgi:hypothetical protein
MSDDSESGGDRPKGSASKPIVDVKLGNVNIDLKDAHKLKGVLNNLLKAVSRGLGTIYEPTNRKRLAKADRVAANERADTIIDLTKKAIELQSLRDKLEPSDNILPRSQTERAISFLLDEAARKLSNNEKLVEAVAEEVQDAPPTQDTSKAIDDDWLTQFWSRAENITDVHVQRFLARLLVKEASDPGAISPLTLSVLTTLTPIVAKRFEHFCRLSIRWDEDVFVIHPNVFAFQNIGPLDDFGVSFDDLYELEAYGLIRSAEAIRYNYTSVPDAPASTIEYAGSTAQLNFSGLQLQQLRFSRAGREIRNLLSLSSLPQYTAALRQKFPDAFIFDH